MTSETLTAAATRLKLKPLKFGVATRLAGKLSALAVAIALGVGSSLYGFANFGLQPVQGSPQWMQRPLTADQGALPYTIGNYLLSGQLPPPATVIDYVRTIDDAGASLSGSCVVEVRGAIPLARWWTLAAVDDDGVAAADESTLTAGTVIVETNGSVVVRISPTPQPGNWIRPHTTGRYRLALTLHDSINTRDAPQPLPAVTQGGC